ncbi:MAG TPA: HD-GYP domain-containing protein [Pirellula sp.]|nr:HD-GYP domain-containing protein [Pirellula sp.]
MSRTFAEIELAYELASRLESAFGSRTTVLQFTQMGWLKTSKEESSHEVHPMVSAALETFDLKSSEPFVWRHNGLLIVIVNMTLQIDSPIAVGIVLPDQNEIVVCSLISAHLEAQRARAEVTEIRNQSELFIDQVTQDFEELTWLRCAHEYFDLCGSKHTIESIALKCLPALASVIRAETIMYIRTHGDNKLETARPDWSSVIATGLSDKHEKTCFRFLTDSLQHLAHGPRVVNIKSMEDHLPGYCGLRNCIALSVAKGPHVYGWILAINKIPLQNAKPSLESQPSHPTATPFGTFEAGLLGAAANIMSSHARNLELFEAQESLLTGVVRAIINAIDAKDAYTCGHSDRVALYAKRIAERLGESVEECERIYMTGLLHDVGKIGVPDSILGKPGALTAEEYAIVKKHPEIGHTILKHLKQLDYVLPGVLHHHEAVNGTGYPAGLAGEAIPLHGRILAVADAYDAMTSDRPYRPGMPSERAESILRDEAGKTWDADIVAVFMECLAHDEIQPHTLESSSACTDFDATLTGAAAGVQSHADSNTSLMRRIAESINSMVVG